MEHYEQLKNESLEGSKDSLKELKNDASAGDGSAQYWLAQYYLSRTILEPRGGGCCFRPLGFTSFS